MIKSTVPFGLYEKMYNQNTGEILVPCEPKSEDGTTFVVRALDPEEPETATTYVGFFSHSDESFSLPSGKQARAKAADALFERMHKNNDIVVMSCVVTASDVNDGFWDEDHIGIEYTVFCRKGEQSQKNIVSAKLIAELAALYQKTESDEE